MNEVIFGQLKIMTIFAISGIEMSFIFDLFRARRKMWKFHNLITYIEDIIFWIISAIILLYTLMKYTTGELRLYMFFGIFLGVIIYFFIFSKYILKILTTIIGFIQKIFRKILYPFKKILKYSKKAGKT